MKFYCDACNTKYAISDDKVRGKILKVRCKNCGNVITVREAVAPIAGRDSYETDPTIATPMAHPSTEDLAVPTKNWYYALNGQTFGPFTLDGLRRKYATAEVGDATYVWHEKLGAWKPVANEPAFAEALATGHKLVPSRKTLGFSGQIEAVKAIEGPSRQRAGAVPNAGHAKRPSLPKPSKKAEEPAARTNAAPDDSRQPASQKLREPKKPEKPLLTPKSRGERADAATSETSRRGTPKPAPTPEDRPLKDPRKENLDRLRSKLGASLGGDGEATADDSLPKPVGGEAIFTYASGIVPAGPDESRESGAADDAIDFNLPPRAKPSKPSPSSTSDILEAVIGPTEEPPSELSEASEVDDSGVIPFFPEGPELSSQIQAATGQEATSESLLIDVDKMNAAKRKRGVAFAVVGVVAILTIVGIGVTIGLQNEPNAVAVADDGPPKQEHKDELEIKRYKKEEVGKLATLNLEDEFLFTEDDVVEGEEPPPAEDDGAEAQGEEKTPVAVTGAAATKKSSSRLKRSTKSKEKPKQPTTKDGAATQAKVEEVEEPEEKLDPLAAVLQPRAHRNSPTINAPVDKLRTERQTTLTKDQARRGFRKIRESIRDCRERHNRYNARLGVGKLKISVTVAPSGKVSTFTVNPRKVQNTEFHNCMKSHRTRWRFASFDGKPMVINTSVIIQ